MAGELVEVFGQTAWFASGTCPAECQGTKFVIAAADGEALEVDAEALFLARRTFQLVQTGQEVKLPLTQTLLGKVIEYLQHHRNTPPAEIRTPLQSDNLQECGVSKWDAAFVNMDKDALFELFVAAIIMGIPSLTYLCVARASLLIKGKPADKLMKDFKVSNDLPGDEEEVLSAAFAKQKEKAKAVPDESGLGGVAVLLAALLQAAERLGVLASGRNEAPGPSTVSLKSFRHACWRALALSDWTQLGSAPEEVRGDRDLVLALLSPSRGGALELASDELRADKAVVLEAVRYTGACLQHAATSLRESSDFVQEAIRLSGTALAGASDRLRGDRAFVLAATTISAAALAGADAPLRANQDFVLECIRENPLSLRYAAEELRMDAAFALRAVQASGVALRYLPSAMQADRSIVAAAVENDPGAVEFAHTSARLAMKSPMPWDSEPRLAAECAAAVGRKGASPELSMGPRLVGVPLSKEAAAEYDMVYCHLKNQKIVQFSAMSTMTANMGQANYIASNAYLDKLPYYERPETDSVTLMWGAVGNIGMRWKAFASQDMLNANPDALMSVQDAAKVLHVTTTRMDPPEWYSASFFDEWSRQSFLAPTAGVHPGEQAAIPVSGAPPWSSPPWAKAKGRGGRKIEEEEEGEEGRTRDSGPLGGWPALGARGLSSTEASVPLEEAKVAAEREAMAEEASAATLEAGTVVRLRGLQAKNGERGTLLKLCSDGRWKVRMEDGTGISLLSECYLVPMGPQQPLLEGSAKSGAARHKAMEERKARLARLARAEAQTEE